jgi:hypothetical protein
MLRLTGPNGKAGAPGELLLHFISTSMLPADGCGRFPE